MSSLEKDIILSKLKELNITYQEDGINLLGLFGSYSRDEATKDSDIDILIETTPKFLSKYRGLKAYVKLDELKNELTNIFSKNIDLVDKQGLLQHDNKYILDKVVYV